MRKLEPVLAAAILIICLMVPLSEMRYTAERPKDRPADEVDREILLKVYRQVEEMIGARLASMRPISKYRDGNNLFMKVRKIDKSTWEGGHIHLWIQFRKGHPELRRVEENCSKIEPL